MRQVFNHILQGEMIELASLGHGVFLVSFFLVVFLLLLLLFVLARVAIVVTKHHDQSILGKKRFI